LPIVFSHVFMVAKITYSLAAKRFREGTHALTTMAIHLSANSDTKSYGKQ